MQFDFNYQPMDFNYQAKSPDFLGQYRKGVTFKQELEREKERKADRERTEQERERLLKLEDDAQAEQNLVKAARTMQYYLDNGMAKEAEEYGITRLQQLTNEGRDTTQTEAVLGKVLQGDYKGASNSIGAFLSGVGKLEQGGGAKVGRFKTNKVGSKLVITDSATGDVVKEMNIPESEKERADLRKAIAQANKAETEAEIKSALSSSTDEKKQASMEMVNEAKTVAREMLNHPGFESATGPVSSMLPTFTDESQDFINLAQRLEALLTVDNLKLMSGVLTDKDISFLTRVGSGLNVTDSGIKGGEKGTRRRIEEILKKLDSVSPENNQEEESPISGFKARVIN